MIKFKFIQFIILVCFSFGYFPDYGPGEQWDVSVSTSQGFITFTGISFNGIPIDSGEGDNTATGSCIDDNCDILAAMYNNIPIGWTYSAIVNDVITLGIELNDGVTEQCTNYPQPIANVLEPIINFHFYDASEQRVYYNVYSSGIVAMGLTSHGQLDITSDGEYVSGYTLMDDWQPFDIGNPVCPLAYADNFTAVGGGGDVGLCDELEVTVSIDIPEQFDLSRAYPNPFNPITNIKYAVSEQSDISIMIYDINGNRIKELYNGNQSAGYHFLNWNAAKQPSGLYFVKMTVDSFSKTQKLMLIK